MTRLDKITDKDVIESGEKNHADYESKSKVELNGILGETNVLIRQHEKMWFCPVEVVADDIFNRYQGYVINKGGFELISMSSLPSWESLELWSLDVSTGNKSWQKVTQITRGKTDCYRFVKTASGNNIKLAMRQKIYASISSKDMFIDADSLNIGDMIPTVRELPMPDECINKINVFEHLNAQHYNSLFVKLREDVDMDMLDDFESIPRKTRYMIMYKPMRVRVKTYIESGMVNSNHNLAVSIDAGKPVGQIPIDLPLTDGMMSFLGYFAARGRVNDRTVVFKLVNKESIQKVQDFLKTFDLGLFDVTGVKHHYGINSTALARIMQSISGNNHTDNRLPKFWPQLDDRRLGLLLRAFFDCYANFDGNQLYTRVDNEGVGGDLQLALTRFGIKSRILTKFVTDNKGLPMRLMMIKINGGSNLELYQKYIGFDVKRKQDLLVATVDRGMAESTQVDFVPIPINVLSDFRLNLELSKLGMDRLAKAPKGYVTLLEDKGQLPLYSFTSNLAIALKGVKFNDNYLSRELKYINKLNKHTWSPVDTITTFEITRMIYDFAIEKSDAYLAGNGGMFLRSKNPK